MRGKCTRCGLDWACTVVGVLPTPQLRTAALLDVMRTEVTQRAQTRKHTMAVSVCFPLDQVVQFDAMATVDTTLWRCQICGQEGTARTTPQATGLLRTRVTSRAADRVGLAIRTGPTSRG
jgi:hypothetical protein